MRKLIGIIALTGLGACAFDPSRMFYQVTQRTASGVSIQLNKGNAPSNEPWVLESLAYMDGMAVKECQALGKSRALFKSETTRTTSAYYTWIERTYSCV